MKIFIDSAITDEIKTIASRWIIDGATTNPSLIKQSWRNLKEVVMEIRWILPQGDISVEVLWTTYEEMIKEAEDYLTWDSNFTIKIPMTQEWLKAVKLLSSTWIKTNVTLVFSVVQALLAAKAWATYVSPFIGRLDDIGEHGVQLVEDIRKIFDNYHFKTQILAASIRSPEHVKLCALAWADVCTIPAKVLQEMLQHPLTEKWLAQFLKDAGK